MVELEKKHKIYYKIHRARSSGILFYILSILVLATSIWMFIDQKNIILLLTGISLFLIINIITEIIGTKGSTLYIASNGITREMGILGKEYTTVNYEDVLRTTITQSLILRMLSYGDIEIDTAGMEEAELDFKNIPNPHKYKKIIDGLIDKANTAVKKK